MNVAFSIARFDSRRAEPKEKSVMRSKNHVDPFRGYDQKNFGGTAG